MRLAWVSGRACAAALGAASAVLAGGLPTIATASAAGMAQLDVVHGIPGAKVKVCVDGKAAIRGFSYAEKVVGVSLPVGRHQVKVVTAGKPCDAAAILREVYRLKAGRNYTIVAAVRPSGAPSLSAFANDVRPVAGGMARLTVRHTAQAPAVNVWAGSTRLIGGDRFTWGDSRTFNVPRGDYRAKVTAPGGRKPLVGPRMVTLKAGRAYQVYAVGTAGHYRLVIVKAAVGTS